MWLYGFQEQSVDFIPQCISWIFSEDGRAFHATPCTLKSTVVKSAMIDEAGGVLLAMKFEDIISVENLLLAWSEFIKGKRHKQDVIEFQLHLMDHIFDLHYSLKAKTYLHGHYEHFKIQ